MITIFNRKELLFTYNKKQWLHVRDVLDSNHIEYVNRLRSAGHNWSSHSDSHVGIDERAYYEYRIYVKKKDFDQAVYLINRY